MSSTLKKRTTNLISLKDANLFVMEHGVAQTNHKIGSPRSKAARDDDGDDDGKDECSKKWSNCFLILAFLFFFGKLTSRHVEPKHVDSVYSLLKDARGSIALSTSKIRSTPETAKRSDPVVEGGDETDNVANDVGAQDTKEASPDAAAVVAASESTTDGDKDTSIVITAPKLPPIHQVKTLIDSLQFLQGLPSTAPIYISIESCPESSDLADLKSQFQDKSHIHFVTTPKYQGRILTIKQAMDQVTTKYVYVLESNSAFENSVDHTNLVKSMEEHPEVLRNIRFRSRMGLTRNYTPCSNGEFAPDAKKSYNGLTFFHTKSFMETNQFAKTSYYKEILPAIGPQPRGLQDPMQKVVQEDCATWGQTLYGASKTFYVKVQA